VKGLGIDIGSRSVELVVTENGIITDIRQGETGTQPLEEVQRLMKDLVFDRMVATGYGRGLIEIAFDTHTVTEIKAYARGAKTLCPRCSSILDIGGQDSKVITLFEDGRIRKFEMNDRCAAGTGKFLEIMARSLGYSLDEFGKRALDSSKEITVSSMCTVFAESEVVSLIAKGEKAEDIAYGLHRSVAKRSVSMLTRVSAQGTLLFAGGGARNSAMQELVKELYLGEVVIPEMPHIVGAYGAALIAEEI
jgi:predicted CoA-substrate-specific enzyme activase